MPTATPILLPQPFPRTAVVNTYGSGSTAPATTVATFARHSLVICSGAGVNPSTLKSRNPNTLALMYISTTSTQVNSVAAGVPLFGEVMWAGHWATLTGTKVASAMLVGDTSMTVVAAPLGGWGSTPFPAAISTPSHTTDEVVVVTNVSGNTLTITRGNWQSVASAQPAGARIGQIVSIDPTNYPLEFYGNISPYAPLNPSTGQRFADYLASFITTAIYSTYPTYDGVFLDNSNTYPLAFPNANLDADNNNVSDGLGGPDGRGVFNGIQSLLSALRRAFAAQTSQKLIVTNGAGWQGQGDGMFFESYQTTYGGTPPAFVQRQYFDRVRAYSATAQIRPVSLVNPTVWSGSATALTGNNSNAYSYDYKKLRFSLAQSLMTDAYFAYDWCPIFHGQTWSFDELDKAAGTALTVAVLTTDTQLTVQASAGFTAGQTIRVPHAAKLTSGTYITDTEDELMTVNGAPPDGTHINVTRAATVKGGQIVGTKVLPDYGVGLPSWLGWMGQPLGPAVETTGALGSDLLASLNGGFETSTSVTSAGAALAAGTFPPTDTFANWSLTVQGGAVGFMTADTVLPQAGSKSCRILVTTGTLATFYNVFIKSAGVALTNGTYYTLTWWAKGDRQQQYQVRINNGANSINNVQQMVMGPVWTQYRMTIQAASTENYFVNFEVANETGVYWFDSVSVQSGDPNVWTRDFEHGFAILNGTNASATVTLPTLIVPPGKSYTTYKKLAGTQDTSVNDGTSHAAATTVTVAALDGLVLTKA